MGFLSPFFEELFKISLWLKYRYILATILATFEFVMYFNKMVGRFDNFDIIMMRLPAFILHIGLMKVYDSHYNKTTNFTIVLVIHLIFNFIVWMI